MNDTRTIITLNEKSDIDGLYSSLYQEETQILSIQNDGTDSTTTLSTTTKTTSKSTYELLNQDHDETHPPLDTIKIVAISDTHGFEQQLTMNEQLLPDGDVVLHCGDFALDGSYSYVNSEYIK